MKRMLWLLVSAVALWASPAGAQLQNSVVVESKNVGKGDSTTVGVFMENDAAIRGLVVPLVIREIDAGSYMTAWAPAYNPAARLEGFLDDLLSVINTYPTENGTCKDNNPGGFAGPGTDPPDFVSPDGLLFTRQRLSPAKDLPPGSDGAPGTGTPSMTIGLTVTGTQGTFEIDTTCVNPANHLLYVQTDGSSVAPSFTKGIITIGYAPVVRDTAWSTDEDTPRAVSYLPASDADGDPLTFSIIDSTQHGMVTGLNANTGGFTYTPDENYNGPDSLSFQATDGTFVSDTGKVRISVSAVNDAPVARDTAIVTDEDTSVDARYQAFDVDGPTLTYQRLSGPFKGSVTAFDPSTGEFTYLPNVNFNGSDSIMFNANDGNLNSNPAYVRITVNPVNDAPVARDTSISTIFETPVNARFQAFDVDGPALTYSKVDGPFNGTFTAFDSATGEFTYTPDTAYSGPDSITFRANDGFEDSNLGTVRITVTPSNCICLCEGDPKCDGEQNVLDIVRVIDVVFFNRLPEVSPRCPVPHADVNCDCSIDVLDLAKMIDIVFYGDTVLCDPCAAGCF